MALAPEGNQAPQEHELYAISGTSTPNCDSTTTSMITGSTPPFSAPSTGQGNSAQALQRPADRPGRTTMALFVSNYTAIVGGLLCFNLGEWIAMLFLILRIEDNNKTWYRWVAWALLFPLSTLGSGLFFYALRRHYRQEAGRRNGQQSPVRNEVACFSPRSLARLSNVLSELFTFVFVIWYFECKAIPLYNSTTWTAAVKFEHEIRAPAVLVCSGYNDAISAQQKDGWNVCNFPEWSKDGSTQCRGDITKKLQKFSTTRYGVLECYDFKLSSDTKFNTTSKELLIKTLVTWNSTDIEHFYQTKAPPGPFLYSIIYDSRVSMNDLSQAIDCGLLSFTEIPAIDFKTVNIKAVKVKDERGAIAPTGTNQHCQNPTFSKLYLDIEPYTTYPFQLSSSSSAYGHICDVGPTGKEEQSCINQMVFHFETFLVETSKSEPGIGIGGIFSTMGSIVGAITFFMYFLTVFAA